MFAGGLSIRSTLTSFSRKNFEEKKSFYADNDQYGVVSLLPPQRVTPGATLHYETQAFNPLLNAHPELSSVPLKLRRMCAWSSLGWNARWKTIHQSVSPPEDDCTSYGEEKQEKGKE